MFSPIERSASASSLSSSSSDSSTTSASNVAIQFQPSRRRISPEQRQALQKMFDRKSHPSRMERVELAGEIGMDLKAVTVWFQNKRQIARKHALAANSNNSLPRNQHHRSDPSTPKHLSSKLRPSISLDHIAELSERPSEPTRPPLTPRRSNTHKLTRSQSEIWMHMPSSPLAAPSSPSADSARLSVLPSRSKMMRSLEWACAKPRVGSQLNKENFPPAAFEFGEKADDWGNRDIDDDTDTEVDEALTPHPSVDFSPPFSLSDCHSKLSLPEKEGNNSYGNRHQDGRRFEDVDAALVLLGFMGQR